MLIRMITGGRDPFVAWQPYINGRKCLTLLHIFRDYSSLSNQSIVPKVDLSDITSPIRYQKSQTYPCSQKWRLQMLALALTQEKALTRNRCHTADLASPPSHHKLSVNSFMQATLGKYHYWAAKQEQSQSVMMMIGTSTHILNVRRTGSIDGNDRK